jgi:hypothetical protein
MSKSAQQSAEKFVRNAGAASQDYVAGAEQTSKDQSALAIAGKANWAAGVQSAISGGRYEKGLQKSGKAGWLAGVKNKGQNRFGEGVANSAGKYAANSARFDTARNAASSAPRGPKGSPANLQRVALVVNALRTTKNA